MTIDANNMPALLSKAALLLLCLVLVVLLTVNAPILVDELKCKVHQAAVTAVVLSCVTVYQLLLTQGNEFVGDNGIDAFYSTNGGECPA